MNHSLWVAVLAYLAEIFEELNKLNSTRQGKQTHLITLSDKVSAFTKNLDLWTRRLFQGTFEMFDQLYETTEKPENAEINKQTVDKFDFWSYSINAEPI